MGSKVLQFTSGSMYEGESGYVMLREWGPAGVKISTKTAVGEKAVLDAPTKGRRSKSLWEITVTIIDTFSSCRCQPGKY